jgi:uncharacterized protein (TIGR02268 family)
MPVTAPFAPGLLAMLLASTAVAARPASSTWESPRVRRIQLEQGASEQVHEVLIGPGAPTVLLFHGHPSGEFEVDLEGRERFMRALFSDDMLTLLPAMAVLPGEAFSLMVRYVDGGAEPASARFRLVVMSPAGAEPLVEVFRRPLPDSFFQRKEREARAEAEQCKAALARSRAECGGLAGLILEGEVNEQGVHGRNAFGQLSLNPEDDFELVEAVSYRANPVSTEGTAPRVRVLLLLRLRLRHAGALSWRAASAEWVSSSGARWRGALVQREPVDSGRHSGFLVVEAELPAEEARGVFSLTLEESGGSRSVSLDGVMFP